MTSPRAMTFGWARFVLPTLLSVVAIATTAGCAGTVVVEYAVKAQISGRYETGHVWRASTDELSYPSLPPGILVAFPPTLYAGKLFEWSFTPSAYAFSGRIKNRIESPICFRFDQAELRSNFQINAIPMRVYTAMQRVSGRIETMVRLGSNNPTIRRRYIHPAYCFQPGQDVIFSFWPDLAELFPTQKMFNVSWSEGVPNLTDRGIGNWITTTIPIEYEGKRETLEVKLTATDSKARIVHY